MGSSGFSWGLRTGRGFLVGRGTHVHPTPYRWGSGDPEKSRGMSSMSTGSAPLPCTSLGFAGGFGVRRAWKVVRPWHVSVSLSGVSSSGNMRVITPLHAEAVRNRPMCVQWLADSRSSGRGRDLQSAGQKPTWSLCPHVSERAARWRPFPTGPPCSQLLRALAPGEKQGSKEGATSAHPYTRFGPWGWKVNLEGVPAQAGRTGGAGRPRGGKRRDALHLGLHLGVRIQDLVMC